MHAVTIEFEFMKPTRPLRRLFHQLGKLGLYPAREGSTRRLLRYSAGGCSCWHESWLLGGTAHLIANVSAPEPPFASGAFRLEMFDGNHFFLQSAKDALLTSIRRDLTAVIATASVR